MQGNAGAVHQTPEPNIEAEHYQPLQKTYRMTQTQWPEHDGLVQSDGPYQANKNGFRQRNIDPMKQLKQNQQFDTVQNVM